MDDTSLKDVDGFQYQNGACEEKATQKRCYVRTRFVLGFMLFFAKYNLYSTRSSLSVVIVAMVGTKQWNFSMTNASVVCPYDNVTQPINTETESGQFDWNSAQQGLALGAYYYGYLISNVIGGYLCHKFGFKAVVGSCIFISSIITIISPVAAKANFVVFVATRILLGLMQGPITPSLAAAVGVWIPPSEVTIITAIVYAGGSAGTLVTLPLAGLASETVGWEFVFYATGGFALIWTMVWVFAVYSSPHTHPRISNEEKRYITRTKKTYRKKNKAKVPWLSMLTSKPFLAAACGYVANNWGFVTMATLMPMYLSSVLHLNLSESGLLSALPYVFQCFVLIFVGFVSDVARKREIATTLTVRKVNSFLCLVVPGALCVISVYIGCNRLAVINLFSLAIGLLGCTATSHEASAIDIAPNFSGISVGIFSTLASIPGFLAPLIAGIILDRDNFVDPWKAIFGIVMGVHTIGFLAFFIFASANRQSWDREEINQREEEDVEQFKA